MALLSSCCEIALSRSSLCTQARQAPSFVAPRAPWPCSQANQPVLGTIPPALLNGMAPSYMSATSTNRPPAVFTPPIVACTPSPEIMLVTSPMLVSGGDGTSHFLGVTGCYIVKLGVAP